MHALDALAASWSVLVAWLAAHAIAPTLTALHLNAWTDDPQEIAGFFLIALLQLAIIALVFRPLESLFPAEDWNDHGPTRIDRAYTTIKLLGVLPLFTYLVLSPLGKLFGGGDDNAGGVISLQGLVPWFNHHPVLLFLVYYAIYDLVYYLIHRLQHAIPWWWALHSLHHSQTHLGCWSNDRDHYLDDLFEALIVAGVSVLIGVSPTDFALLVMFGELLQNFSHANVRIRFGPVLDKLLVDPRYHRLHHMRVDPDRPNLHNCNFALVFPLWDLLFGTALYGESARPTGLGDPMVNRENDRGIVAQQLAGLRRFRGALLSRAGWRPGDVAFDERHRPVPVGDFDLHELEREGRPLRTRE
jgi:sterol desaturase/sphingolipid hydroxylase (fatty acid hydroxylase superfamily)